MKVLLKIWLLLALGASAAAGNYRLIGTARMAGFDVMARKLTALTSRIAPEAKALPAFMFAAMAFNPDFAAFDLTDGVVVGYYLPEQGPVPAAPLWCLSLAADDGAKIPSGIKLFGRPAKVRTVGKRLLVSWSAALVDGLDQPPAAPDSDHDLYLRIAAGEYCRRLSADVATVRQYLFRQVLVPAAGNTDNRALQLRLEYLQKLLAQSGEAEAFLDLNGASARITVRLTPEKNSALAGFLSRQQRNPGALPPLPEEHAAALSVNLALDAALRNTLDEFCLALADQPRTAPWNGFVRALIAAADGRAVITADPQTEGGESVRALVRVAPERLPAVRTALAAFPVMTGKPQLHQLGTAGKRPVVAATGTDRVGLSIGSAPSTAADLLTETATAPPTAEPGRMLLGKWNVNGAEAMTLEGRCADGAMVFNAELTAPLMRAVFPHILSGISRAAGVAKGRK